MSRWRREICSCYKEKTEKGILFGSAGSQRWAAAVERDRSSYYHPTRRMRKKRRSTETVLIRSRYLAEPTRKQGTARTPLVQMSSPTSLMVVLKWWWEICWREGGEGGEWRWWSWSDSEFWFLGGGFCFLAVVGYVVAPFRLLCAGDFGAGVLSAWSWKWRFTVLPITLTTFYIFVQTFVHLIRI